MIIGYDAKRAVSNMTGLGNYSRFVIDSMSREYPDNEYRLYAPKLKENPRLTPLLGRGDVRLCLPECGAGKRLGSLWRSGWGLTEQLRRDKVALYHGLSNELPLNIRKSGAASVVTIHDLIYRRVPEDYTAIDRKLYDYKYGSSARNATRVIAISERTRADLISDYDIDPDKIDVIYQGCDDVFTSPISMADLLAVKEKFDLPERFIAGVGTVQSRKNQLLTVKALRGLPDDVKLVIVGRRIKDYARKIDDYVASSGLGERVIWVSGASLKELAAIYTLATISSYPSRYEGFGIPVIESINCGTPVIAATGSCLEEAGGPGALYVDPDDVDQFVSCANNLLDDTALCDKMTAAGREYVKRFNNADFARLTMASYQRALGCV